MNYQLVFSPRLNITPGDFVDAWNEDDTTRTIAQASLAPTSGRAYNDPLLEAAWLLVSTVGTGMLTNALYDLVKNRVKNLLVKKGSKKHVKITQLDQPDGTHLLVIEEDES